MSEEEMRELAALDPASFDPREHAALCWVRETLTRRGGASRETTARFEEAFDERERRRVVAAMKSMYFFNLAGNTLDRWLRMLAGRPPEPYASCPL